MNNFQIDDKNLQHVENEAERQAIYQEAAKYAEETERFTYHWMEVGIKTNDGGEEIIIYGAGDKSCSCAQWRRLCVCSHVLALERVIFKLATNDIEQQQEKEAKEVATTEPLR